MQADVESTMVFLSHGEPQTPEKASAQRRATPVEIKHENIMGYQRYRRSRQAMGDLASTITTVLDVASDAALPEVVCRIQQLQAIDRGQQIDLSTCAETPAGVGAPWAQRALPALRGYVYAQQNKWVYPVAALALIGIPMWIGYELGKGR